MAERTSGVDIVIYVKSCLRDREAGLHDAIRDTWARLPVGADVRFVLGSIPFEPRDDELRFPVVDDYNHLWLKTRIALNHAQTHGYKWSFHACTDTYIVIPRLVTLLTSVLPDEAYYIGCATGEGHASGGAGYALEDLAMWTLCHEQFYAQWEDKLVHDLLRLHDIRLRSLPIFRGSEPRPWDDDTVSVHLGTHTGSMTKERLYACHHRFTGYAPDA